VGNSVDSAASTSSLAGAKVHASAATPASSNKIRTKRIRFKESFSGMGGFG
jgi:hypothetical protein